MVAKKQMGPEALTIWFGQLLPCFVRAVYWLEVRHCRLHRHMLRQLPASLFFHFLHIWHWLSLDLWCLCQVQFQSSTHDLWRVSAACQTSCRKYVLGLFLGEFSRGVDREYRWSGPLSSLSAGCLSEQRVWDVLHSFMLRPAMLQHSSQTTNTISTALLRHSDLSPRSDFFFFTFFFSLCEEHSTGAVCNFTHFPLGRYGPVHSQAIFWTVV